MKQIGPTSAKAHAVLANVFLANFMLFILPCLLVHRRRKLLTQSANFTIIQEYDNSQKYDNSTEEMPIVMLKSN